MAATASMKGGLPGRFLVSAGFPIANPALSSGLKAKGRLAGLPNVNDRALLQQSVACLARL
ncbi:hypothetical protein [Rhizobium binae]|uniref:hypothetical protein n=1 Tax=Rhizobium binae TaxID=1138190 RepID=UPI001C82CDC0|nr:hypothetical protein [Rhizobium binae]MBX4945731.1 hypothetical protein [Rhizobium binae]MBX4964890.1 hypothetical protein [Rhizobium binae]MBX4971150.1 hypothetical protein [Rhizobium binae]MBX4981176.1 hypothetical protein [Rhizobium binae]